MRYVSSLVSLLICLFLFGCTKSRLEVPPASPANNPVDPCAPTLAALQSGNHTILENYNEGTGPSQFSAATASCWKTYTSAYSFMQEEDIEADFNTHDVDGMKNSRWLNIKFRAGMETNHAVDYSPHTVPDTGWNSGRWPYVIDLLKQPQCYSDVTVSAKVESVLVAGAVGNYGLVLNGNVSGSGLSRKISGYFLHVNDGGASATLMRLEEEPDYAFDFADHFPGAFGEPNPRIDGPYKGWNFWNGLWAAGGSLVTASAPKTLAARYQYDPALKQATLSWEIRPVSGADGSPGGWDQTVTLSGSDALAPGGGFGIFDTYYGAAATGATSAGGLAIAELRLACSNP